MSIKPDVGIGSVLTDPKARERRIRYINLKLATHGLPHFEKCEHKDLEIAHDLIESFREKNRLLANHHCPADRRIQRFIEDYFKDFDLSQIKVPSNTFELDRYGLAREMSLPADKDDFYTDIITSYRIKQGVLHNPKNDRRTTKGSFHIAEGGLPIPFDKKSVPRQAFLGLLKSAINPPKELLKLPFTASQEDHAETFVSLLLRPLVCPEVPGFTPEKRLEIRFFAPGNLVANLDFVESIFGNAGDPSLPANDAALDPEHWTGHTGCIILAPHLIYATKKELGLPKYEDATDRQRADGMCWKNATERYNDGTPFKITCRDERGVMITLIADNYFGYSKKEVKTQIGYSANLLGLTEEEHAGGAIAFPSYNLGTNFVPDSNLNSQGHSIKNLPSILGDKVEMKPEGYGVDKNYPTIVYLPEDATIDLESQMAKWTKDGKEQSLRVLPEYTYLNPTGYKVRMEKHPQTPAWRLVGTNAEGTLCHKPCTVSGGGKSEISKSLWDAIQFGPVFITDYDKDMQAVEEIINKDYGTRFKPGMAPGGKNHVSRPILSTERSLGSVIKLLTPTEDCTDEFNDWLRSIPNYIKSLVYTIKRFYQPEWGDNWKDKFSVDIINGSPGNQFKYMGRPIQGAYLRVGMQDDGSGWTYKLRQDFMPADKVCWEDDISASVVVPANQLKNLDPNYSNPSVKIINNCESRFFQRPDEAVHRGYDKQAEADLASEGNFISNFEPLEKRQAQELIENTIPFYQYTQPMQDTIRFVADQYTGDYFISSSHPRIVDGKPTKNPRYLQVRPDLVDPKMVYLAEIGTRLYRKVPADKPVYLPVNAVLPGRRNNPADHEAGIRPLAVYGPIHYQELPELFMDFVCSLTGKSPSTTGAGSEGALTKGPFNALVPTSDLNNALLSFILTGYNGFSSAAGYIGTEYRMDHDVSLLIPELWSRLREDERNPQGMIESGYLEKVEDFDYQGEKILGSRLGYRITREFTTHFLGRMFDSPEIVFDDRMLKPELQSMDDYVDGIKNICEAQEKVAKAYLADGSVNAAIPPLKAIIHIMAEGHYEGKDANHPDIRKLFERDEVLKSDWYKARLELYQQKTVTSLKESIAYLQSFVENPHEKEEALELGIPARLEACRTELKKVESKDYLAALVGTLGADPLCTSLDS